MQHSINVPFRNSKNTKRLNRLDGRPNHINQVLNKKLEYRPSNSYANQMVKEDKTAEEAAAVSVTQSRVGANRQLAVGVHVIGLEI